MSLGAADLAALAQSMVELLKPDDLAAGEGLALLSSNAFTYARACTVLMKLRGALEQLVMVVALTYISLRANPSSMHPTSVFDQCEEKKTISEQIFRLCRSITTTDRVQPFLSLRDIGDVLGAFLCALNQGRCAVLQAVNGTNGNPVVDVEEHVIRSASCYNTTHSWWAMASVQLALAPVLQCCDMHVQKMLSLHFRPRPDVGSSERPVDGKLYRIYAALVPYASSSSFRRAFECTSPSAGLASLGLAEGVEDFMSPLPATVAALERVCEEMETLLAVQFAVACDTLPRSVVSDLDPTLAAMRAEVMKHCPLEHQDEMHPYSLAPLRSYFRKRIESCSVAQAWGK